ISTKITNAVSSAREGTWAESQEAVQDALSLLQTILPHLEEAAEAQASGVLPSTPPPSNGGGMGYRGSSYSQAKQAAQTAVKTAPVKRAPHSSIPKPIPIPEPVPEPPVDNTPPVKFDISRMPGRPEFLACLAQGSVETLYTEEMLYADIFSRISDDIKSIHFDLYSQKQ